MIANKVYTRDEMREEHIITSDYRFIDKEGEYFAKLIMRAEASKNMMRLFFQLSHEIQRPLYEVPLSG